MSPLRSPAMSTRPGDPTMRAVIAWPVLRSVAEFVVSRVIRTARGYEIPSTVGPARSTHRRQQRLHQHVRGPRARRERPRAPTMIGEPPACGARSPTGWSSPETVGGARSSTMMAPACPSRRAACRRAQPACFRSAIEPSAEDGTRDLPLCGSGAGAAVCRCADAQRVAAGYAAGPANRPRCATPRKRLRRLHQ